MRYAVALVKSKGRSIGKTAQRAQATAALRKSRQNPRRLSPADVVMHLHQYAQQSAGRTVVVMDDFTYRTAPGSVTARLAGLRQVFTGVHRSGPFISSDHSVLGLGNPADSAEVAEFMEGYRQLYFDHGMDPQAAVPFSDGACILARSMVPMCLHVRLIRGLLEILVPAFARFAQVYATPVSLLLH